jgi:hypothetical protein
MLQMKLCLKFHSLDKFIQKTSAGSIYGSFKPGLFEDESSQIPSQIYHLIKENYFLLCFLTI